jgi:hypothetical protein
MLYFSILLHQYCCLLYICTATIMMLHLFSYFIHLIKTCFGLTRPTSYVYPLAKLFHCHLSISRVNVILFLILKPLKSSKVCKIADSVTLRGVCVLLVALFCGYKFPAELDCSVCVCVCVCERERERESVCVCVCVQCCI